MFRKILLLGACLVVTVATLVSCDRVTTPTYQSYVPPSLHSNNVKVIWVQDPDNMCKVLMGNSKFYHSDFLGCSARTDHGCTIIMPKPEDFNDKSHLTILGHEFLHCLGAGHE